MPKNSKSNRKKNNSKSRVTVSWWSTRKPLLLFMVAFAAMGVYFIVNSFAYRTIGNSTGTFNAYCDYSHRSNDDPIVFPGVVGAAHSHDFFGSTSTNAFSTNQSIQQSTTSCQRFSTPPPNNLADKSAYWVPTLYVNDQPVQARRLSAMYKADYREVQKIQPFPAGLKVIAGTSTGGPGGVNGIRIWWFECHVTPTISPGSDTVAPTCQDFNQKDASFDLVIRFPDCWDGVNLDSANHKSHMAYSSQKTTENPIRRCPGTHPVLVPSLQLVVQYPTNAGPTTRLSSGGLSTAHADFMNGWPQSVLANLVNDCLRIDNYCGGSDKPVPGHAGNEIDPLPTTPGPGATTASGSKSSASSYGSSKAAGTPGGASQNGMYVQGANGDGAANPHSVEAGMHPGAAQLVYAVTIKVVDKNGKPMGNAKVVMGNRVAYSDAKGVAVFSDTEPGHVQVKASGHGATVSSRIEVADNGRATEIQSFTIKVSERKPSAVVAAIVGVIATALLIYRAGGLTWLHRKLGR